MSDTLLPVIQVAFGSKEGTKKVTTTSRMSALGAVFERSLVSSNRSYITTVPPDFIQEFTYMSGSGADKFTLTFLDYTYGELEQKIMEIDRYKNNIYVRWGYPKNGLKSAPWHIMLLQNYQPSITYSGLRMTLSGVAEGSEFSTLVEPKTYTGKISDVIRSIAHEMGFSDENIFIEETDDNYRVTTKDEWSTSGKTRIDLINNYLIDKARSLENPQGNYTFHLSSLGTFHFHTQFYSKVRDALRGTPSSIKDKNYRKFKVLHGMPTNVIEFIPSYDSASLGMYSASCVAAVYDPRTKQLQQTLVDRKTQGMSTDHDPKKGARTPAAPFTDSKDSQVQRKKVESYAYRPVKRVALGGHCSGKQIHKHTGPQDAVNEITSAWKHLHSCVYSASLTLVGTPDAADFTAREQFCDISVILPHLENSKESKVTNRLHWSSGLYHIREVTHTISNTYTITAQLDRMTASDGAGDAKTGSPVKTPSTYTSTAR